MDFDLNEEYYSSKPYDPSVPEADDYGWWETVGLQIDKDVITEMSFSENLQYNKTIAGIMNTDAEKADSAVGAAMDWAADWGTPDSGFTKETINWYDKQLASGKIAFDENGNQIAGEPNADAKTWWKLKSQGYTPQTLHQKVLENSRNEIMDLSTKLKTSDSTTAQIMGGMSAWLADPVNFSALVGEIVVYGFTKSPIAASMVKGMLKSKTFKNGVTLTAGVGNKVFNKKVGDIILNRFNDIQRTRKAEAVRLIGSKPWHEYRKVTSALEKAGTDPRVIRQIVQKKLKNGEFKYGDKIQKLVDRNARKQIMSKTGDILLYSGAGYATEALHQLSTFDFKHDVLPEYTKEDALKDKLISMGVGGAGGGVVDAGISWMSRRGEKLTAEGILTAETAGEVADNITKSVSDLSQGKNIDIDPENPPFNFDQEYKELTPEKLDEYAKQAETDPDFEPIKAEYDKEIGEYEKIKQCIMGGNQNTIENQSFNPIINK